MTVSLRCRDAGAWSPGTRQHCGNSQSHGCVRFSPRSLSRQRRGSRPGGWAAGWGSAHPDCPRPQNSLLWELASPGPCLSPALLSLQEGDQERPQQEASTLQAPAWG